MAERNVVLLVLDTVRKDVFDECAAGIRERSDLSFDRAYAPSSWTVPSHGSMFTGELPHRHGVHADNIDFADIDVSDTFLPELDRHTIGLSANSFLSARFGFDTLFDEFDSLHGNEELLFGGIDSISFIEGSDRTGVRQYLDYLRYARSESALLPSLVNAAYMKLNNAGLSLPIPRIGDYGARAVLRAALNRSPTDEPFFLFANLIDAHAPHEVLRGYDTDVSTTWTSREHDVWEVNLRGVEEFPEYTETFEELYRCSVRYLDERVCSFVDDLQARTDGNTTVIVTADHGEEMGKAGERTLGHKLPSAAVSHVPLEVINPPPAWEADEGTDDDVVSLLDVGALVRGIAADERVDLSRDVAPVERIGDPSPPDERTAFWDRGIRAVFAPDEAFEWDTEGARTRYEVSKSAQRLVGRDVDIPEWCHAEFEIDIEETAAAGASGADLDDVDDDTRRRLENLGYMG
jgi:hypothetical protein